MLGYSVFAVVAVVHTVVKTPRGELRDSGMGIILVGVVVALVPTLVSAVDWMFLRGLNS